MFISERMPGVAATNLARSPWLRDLAMRRDRIPQDERTDMPEVEEAFRVSFSESVRAGAGSPVRDGSLPREGADARLQRYRDIERL
jgi:hypothetical protein